MAYKHYFYYCGHSVLVYIDVQTVPRGLTCIPSCCLPGQSWCRCTDDSQLRPQIVGWHLVDLKSSNVACRAVELAQYEEEKNRQTE